MDPLRAKEDRCDELVCLTLGHEFQPRRLSIEGGGDDLLRLPVVAFLVHGPGGWLLIDTGLSTTMRDPGRARRIYRTRTPEFASPGDPLLEALARCELSVTDISAVALSHLHVDHTGGLRHFAGTDAPPVFVQARELEFGLAHAGLAEAYVREDFADPGPGWVELDGDAKLVPGVESVFTPGHTPGHMSFRVRLRTGETWILAMDAIDLQDGIDADTPIGSSARPQDVAARRSSHARLMELARCERARLIPGHCPTMLPTLPALPRAIAAGGPIRP